MVVYTSPPSGAAGGDLSGTYPNPGVAQAAGGLKLPNIATPATPSAGVQAFGQGGGLFYVDPNGAVMSLAPTNKVGAPMPGALAETANRSTVSGVLNPASGTLYIFSVQLMAGQSVGHIGFCTGNTAATTPSHWWAALLDNTYKQQAHSADQLTAALPASTWQNLAMVTPFVAAYTGTYYLAIMIAATGMPNLIANQNPVRAEFITGTGVPTPLVGGASSTALTVPGTDGTTVYAAPNAAVQTAYAYAAA